MIILLYGKDTYRSRQKLDEIINYYKKTQKKGLDLSYFDFEKDTYQDFKERIRSVSMFKEKKIVILRNAINNESFKKDILRDHKWIAKLDDAIVFHEAGEISEKNKLFQFLKKYGKHQEFKPLDGLKLKKWVLKEFEKQKARISAGALERIINSVGNNSWRMVNEIKKLIAYKKGTEVDYDDVGLLVKPKIETGIFKTIDAVASKNKNMALSLIRQHLDGGDSPLYLLSMINFQFRNLLIMKSFEERGHYSLKSAGELGIHPYVAKKTAEQSVKFSLEGLKKIYRKIFQFDLAIKKGRIDAETALYLLITEI